MLHHSLDHLSIFFKIKRHHPISNNPSYLIFLVSCFVSFFNVSFWLLEITLVFLWEFSSHFFYPQLYSCFMSVTAAVVLCKKKERKSVKLYSFFTQIDPSNYICIVISKTSLNPAKPFRTVVLRHFIDILLSFYGFCEQVGSPFHPYFSYSLPHPFVTFVLILVFYLHPFIPHQFSLFNHLLLPFTSMFSSIHPILPFHSYY